MCKVMSIAERLKDAPKGTRLWCTILGEVELVDVNWNRADYPIKVVRPDKGMNEILTKDGRLYSSVLEADCILFPSKNNRDWSTFDITPVDTPCMVNDSNNANDWLLRYYAKNGRLFDSQLRSSDVPSVESLQFTSRWKYVVPVSKFDFTNPAANFERSIV